MKRRLALAIALAVSVFSMSLVSPNLPAQAQQRQSFRADTGFVTLGSNQVLRVTVAWDLDNDGAALVGFRRIDYVQANCSGSVCKHVVANPNPVGDPQPVELMSGEAASMDITPMPGSSGVRAVVVSNRRDVRVIAQIIDTDTGRVVATFSAGQDARMDTQ